MVFSHDIIFQEVLTNYTILWSCYGCKSSFVTKSVITEGKIKAKKVLQEEEEGVSWLIKLR